MAKMDKVGSYDFLAEPFHCDAAGRLFMGHLGNHLLNAADFHSHDRGFGMRYLNSIHRTWVLSRLAIEMQQVPSMYRRFTVDTWVESAMRFFTNRNFRVHDPATGTVFGYGRSIWAMIDTETRQPANLLEVNGGTLVDYVDRERTCPIAKASRVNVGAEAHVTDQFTVRYSDIDINGHLNSVKYIEHALDLFTPQWHCNHPLRRIEIAYVAEAHCGDTIRIARETDDDGFTHRLKMTRRDSGEEVEICRCLLSFVKD